MIRGRFQYASRQLASPIKQVLFRLVNCTVGRLAPDLIRRILQRRLITGKRFAPFLFERRIAWGKEGWIEVQDRVVRQVGRAPRLEKLYGSTDATSIYVATSSIWQEASLEIWEDLATAVEMLRTTGSCQVTRRYN